MYTTNIDTDNTWLLSLQKILEGYYRRIKTRYLAFWSSSFALKYMFDVASLCKWAPYLVAVKLLQSTIPTRNHCPNTQVWSSHPILWQIHQWYNWCLERPCRWHRSIPPILQRCQLLKHIKKGSWRKMQRKERCSNEIDILDLEGKRSWHRHFVKKLQNIYQYFLRRGWPGNHIWLHEPLWLQNSLR